MGKSKKNSKSLISINKLRSRIWKLNKSSFKNYYETAKAASFVYKEFKSSGKKGNRSNKFILESLGKYYSSIAPEVLLPSIPVFLNNYEDPFPYWELDEKFLEMSSVGEDIEVRSHLSSIYSFRLLQYNYTDTFKSYVDKENELFNDNGGKSGEETLISFDVRLNETKTEYYLWVGIDGADPSEEVAPNFPDKNEIEPIEDVSPSMSKEDKAVNSKLVKEELKKVELEQKKIELDILRETVSFLRAEKEQYIKDIAFYKARKNKKEVAKVMLDVTKIDDELRRMNRKYLFLLRTVFNK